MQETNPSDRMVRLYFGKPGENRPTKAEVRDFIVADMGLVRGDEKPQWSEGICELIQYGMDSWDTKLSDTWEHEEQIDQLEAKVRAAQNRVDDLEAELEMEKLSDTDTDVVAEVHRTEARILEILCRDDNIGAKSPNFVPIDEIAAEIDVSRQAVSNIVEAMEKPELGGHVEVDRHGGRVKTADPGAFVAYCGAVRMSPEKIREANR